MTVVSIRNPKSRLRLLSHSWKLDSGRLELVYLHSCVLDGPSTGAKSPAVFLFILCVVFAIVHRNCRPGFRPT